jgi:uncharacterized protein YyaL (SSP411 family)
MVPVGKGAGKRRVVWLLALLGALLALAGSSAWLPRAHAEESRPASRLATELSPYLRAHAHNPVNWYPWGPEAFAKAKRENKPIFLSIGYAACHWCHVMEQESFADTGIATQLNAGFVSIKVDREERPDVDELYITAIQLSGERTGWPLSAFLTPEGKPFFGATYIKRDEFAELLRKIHETWSDPAKRKPVEESAARLAAAVGEAALRPPQKGSASPALVSGAVQALLADLDAENGGFGRAPKFPPPARLELLLAEHARKPNPAAIRAVKLTLDRMARGGLYDQVGGGFHRYSVDAAWRVPHFEKMLYDNAQLASLYLRAHQVTKSAEYRRIAVETLEFALRELRDPKGGFRSSVDADSLSPTGEREEGRFYTWTPAETVAVLGKVDGALFNRIYGIKAVTALTAGEGVDGRAIPNLLARPLEAYATELKTTPTALRTRLAGMRTRLRTARVHRTRPLTDDKVLANWNGLMIRALVLAYDVTSEERYRKAALETAEFVLAGMCPGGRLVHTYRDGKTGTTVFLDDYASMILALLDLRALNPPGAALAGEDRWLAEARTLAKGMQAAFWDAQATAFYTTPRDHEPLLARPGNPVDAATPSGQSLAALALARLARITGEAEYRDRVRVVLDGYATDMKRYPTAMPAMLLAANSFFTADPSEPEKVVPPAFPGGLPGLLGSTPPVTVKLEDAPTTLQAGQEFTVTVRLVMGAEWHVNANPAAAEMIPTQVTALPGPFRLLGAEYPKPTTLQAPYAKTPLLVYQGTVAIRVRLKAEAGAKPEALRLKVRYQACNEQLCLRPEERIVTPSPLPRQ